jgi:hypothetical protein
MDKEAPPEDVEEHDGSKDSEESWELLAGKLEVLFQACFLTHDSPRARCKSFASRRVGEF